MSNVLIGIIGVILFIGLALAGALFLGPRFQEATTNSKAAASVQVMKQIADAANLFTIQEGTAAVSGYPNTLGSYLKSTPSNPTGGYNPDLHSIDGNFTGKAVYSVMEIRDEKVCASINRSLGNPAGNTVPDLATYPTWQGGCFRQSAQFGNNPPGVLVGFMRI
jgi:hypothetical protein